MDLPKIPSSARQTAVHQPDSIKFKDELQFLEKALTERSCLQARRHVWSLIKLIQQCKGQGDFDLIKIICAECGQRSSRFNDIDNNFTFDRIKVEALLVLLEDAVKNRVEEGDYVSSLNELIDKRAGTGDFDLISTIYEKCKELYAALTDVDLMPFYSFIMKAGAILGIHAQDEGNFVKAEEYGQFFLGLSNPVLRQTESMSAPPAVNNHAFTSLSVPVENTNFSQFAGAPVAHPAGSAPDRKVIWDWFSAASDHVGNGQYGDAKKMYDKVKNALQAISYDDPLSNQIEDELTLHAGIYQSTEDYPALSAMGFYNLEKHGR